MRTTWMQRLLLTICLATFVACGADRAAENAERLWQVDTLPTLSIGEEEEPENPSATLQRITGATRLPGGSVLVSDLGEFALKVFDTTGAFVRAFGRSGAGPGEVTYAARLFRCGDSLYVYDIDGNRTSLFTLEGEYVRRFSFDTPEGERVPYSAGSDCNPSGAFVHYGWGDLRAGKPGVHRGRVPLWLTATPDGPATTIDSIAGSERWGQTVNGQFVGTGPLPLGKQPVSGIGRSRAYAGTADSFHVRVYDLQGNALPPLRRDLPPEPLAPEDVAEYKAQRLATASASGRASLERELAEIAFPTVKPAYIALLVDREDHVWVQHPHELGSRSSTWSVFGPDGAFVTEVRLPRILQPLEIGRDYVLGRYLDPESSLPLVRMYRLQRGDGD